MTYDLMIKLIWRLMISGVSIVFAYALTRMIV